MHPAYKTHEYRAITVILPILGRSQLRSRIMIVFGYKAFLLLWLSFFGHNHWPYKQDALYDNFSNPKTDTNLLESHIIMLNNWMI